ncbi:MAG: hypothetical protein M3198_19130, partial [Actinomycetota bacterium]|nr:hypothetical protein [Actinomycetota bacterium]
MCAVLLTATACGSTNQQQPQDESVEVAQEQGDGASADFRVNKKGQVVDAKGRVVKGARVTKSGRVVDAEGEVIGAVGERGGRKQRGERVASADGSSGRSRGTSGSGSRRGGSKAASCSFEGCTRAAGVSSNKIKLGFMITEGFEQAAASYGVPINYGNQRRQVTALVEDLNRRGGILGREVEPVFGVFRPQENAQAQAQRLCTQFTEDEPVLAVISFGGSIGDLRVCLAQRHTFLIDHTFTSRDDDYLRQLAPWFRLPGSKTESR